MKQKYLAALSQQRRLTSCQSALGERIPLISRVTDTQRDVVPHIAIRPGPTETRTRVPTLSRDAGQLWGTVGVENTLRLTVGGRPDHVRQTGALTPGSGLPGDGRVGTTRVGKAGIFCFYWLNG